MKLFIDIGGTHLRSELHNGREVICGKCSSRENDLVTFIENIITEYGRLSFVGISFAGQVNNGEILSSPNINVTQRKIKAYFETRYALRLEIDNDLNCAVRAEAKSLKAESIAALYVGTGLGAAIIDGGKLVRGWRNQAFELGHIPYREAPFSCGCGKNNCIELFASGGGIERWLRYNKEEGSSIKPNLEKMKRQNDPLAEMFEHALLHAAATLVTLANPKTVVLGGGIIQENPYLVPWIREHIVSMALPTSLEGLQIVQTTLQNAAMDGAKLLEERE